LDQTAFIRRFCVMAETATVAASTIVGSKVFVKDRTGEVVMHSPTDALLTFKVCFEDGNTDWFKHSDVCFQDESKAPLTPVPASTDEAPAPSAPSVVQPEQFKLSVSMLQAHGFKHMNHFTGDHPYVTCQVQHLDESKEVVKVETKPATEGDMLNPFWGETHTLSPWSSGEALEFTVYDKGLISAKTEGKILIPPELFYPQGFSGMLAISGLPHALLHVIIRPLGPVVSEAPAAETSSKKKRKKVKVNKKKQKLLLSINDVVSLPVKLAIFVRSMRKVAVSSVACCCCS